MPGTEEKDTEENNSKKCWEPKSSGGRQTSHDQVVDVKENSEK